MQCSFGGATTSECMVSILVEYGATYAFSGWWMMGSRSLRCMSSVNGSFCNRLEGSLLGRLCSAMLVSGLRRLGRKMLMSFGSSGI